MKRKRMRRKSLRGGASENVVNGNSKQLDSTRLEETKKKASENAVVNAVVKGNSKEQLESNRLLEETKQKASEFKENVNKEEEEKERKLSYPIRAARALGFGSNTYIPSNSAFNDKDIFKRYRPHASSIIEGVLYTENILGGKIKISEIIGWNDPEILNSLNNYLNNLKTFFGLKYNKSNEKNFIELSSSCIELKELVRGYLNSKDPERISRGTTDRNRNRSGGYRRTKRRRSRRSRHK